MNVIDYNSKYNTIQLEYAMIYRNYTQSKLAKEIKGLSQSNLSKFIKGYYGVIKEDKLKEIMKHLNFPFEFLFINLDSQRVKFH